MQRRCAHWGNCDSNDLARIHVHCALCGARQRAIDRHALCEANHGEGRGRVVVREVVGKGNRAASDLVPDLGIAAHIHHTASDGQTGEAVITCEHQRSRAHLLQCRSALPGSACALSHRVAFRDFQGARTLEVQRLAEREVGAPGRDPAAVDVHIRIGSQIVVVRYDHEATVQLRDARVSIGRCQAQHTAACFDEAVVSAVTVAHHVCDGHEATANLIRRNRRHRDRAHGTTDAAIRETHGAREGHIRRRSVEGVIDCDVTGELHRIGQRASINEAVHALRAVAAENTAIEDQSASAKGGIRTRDHGLRLVEGGESRVAVRGIHERRAATTEQAERVRLCAVVDGTEDHVVRASH